MRIRSHRLHLLAAAALLTLVCGCRCPAPANPEATASDEPGAETSPEPESAANPNPSPGEPAAAPAPPEVPPVAETLPGQGEPCTADQRCADDLTCVSYYGIAGRAGPEFHSCEIQCGEGASACPDGQNCTTIADGPGPVCRVAPPSK